MPSPPPPNADLAARLRQQVADLRAAGRHDDAVEPLRKLVGVSPPSGVAEHNLAALLGDLGRWTEAEAPLRAAFRKGLDAPETWLIEARRRQAIGLLDEAEAAFREAIKRRRDYYDAHRELAQLVWMRTGDSAAAVVDVDRALAGGVSPGLVTVKAQALEFAGRQQDALDVLKAQLSRGTSAPMLVQAGQLATALGHDAEALDLTARALGLTPMGFGARLTRLEALLGAGRAEEAAQLGERLQAEAPDNQHVIALLATAWRLLGDDRYRVLYDYEALVAPMQLYPPAGWPDLSSYVADVAGALTALHGYREHPFNQSLRHGSQAVDILQQEHPALRALPQALDGPIRQHLERLGTGSDPVRRRNTGSYTFQGMWSVKLRPGGFHVNHVHPKGWLSSACYVETVDRPGQEGWIKFGEPGVRTKPPLAPEHAIKPEPGMLVLFPSYMWHGVTPFGGDKSRLTFAFDLVPA